MARNKEFEEGEVLARARDLFWKQGYTATSIQDLENHLGLSRSSIYRFFGGKRELYDRTLAIYQDDSLGGLQRTLAGSEDLRQTLIDLFSRVARQQNPGCEAEALGCYVVNATTEMANSCARALTFVADNRERFVDILSEALANARERGELSTDADPYDLANYLFLCYNGLQVVVQTRIDRETLVRSAVRSVEGLPWTGQSPNESPGP